MKSSRDVADANEEAQKRLLGFERQFRRAGLPLFIEDFSAATDVYNRALPILIRIVVSWRIKLSPNRMAVSATSPSPFTSCWADRN